LPVIGIVLAMGSRPLKCHEQVVFKVEDLYWNCSGM